MNVLPVKAMTKRGQPSADEEGDEPLSMRTWGSSSPEAFVSGCILINNGPVLGSRSPVRSLKRLPMVSSGDRQKKGNDDCQQTTHRINEKLPQ
jgi:hypothetical protein